MYYRSSYLKDFSYGQYNTKDPIKPRIGTEIKFNEYINLLKPNMKDHIKKLRENIILDSIISGRDPITSYELKKINLLNKITNELRGRVISSNNSTYEQSLIDYLNNNEIILSYIPFNVSIELYEKSEKVYDDISVNIRIKDGFLLIDKIEKKEDNCNYSEDLEIINSIYHDYEIISTLSWPCYKISKIEIRDIFTNEFYKWSSI